MPADTMGTTVLKFLTKLAAAGIAIVLLSAALLAFRISDGLDGLSAVSYTHLTLPTN